MEINYDNERKHPDLLEFNLQFRRQDDTKAFDQLLDRIVVLSHSSVQFKTKDVY